MNIKGVQPGIQTPLELDLAARIVERLIRKNASPLRRFIILTNFFLKTEHLPLIWTVSYYRSFYRTLSIIIRHEYVRWCDPKLWLITVRVLLHPANTEWIKTEPDFEDTFAAAMKKCCVSLASAGAYRELHTLLSKVDPAPNDANEAEWAHVFNARTLNQNPLAVFKARFYPSGNAPVFLQSAIISLERFREDCSAPAVLFVDATGSESTATGTVIHPLITATASSVWRARFGNQLANDETNTLKQLYTALQAARHTVERHFDVTLSPRTVSVHFPDHYAAYSGESMGLSVALNVLGICQSQLNLKQRLQIQNAICCSGGVTEDGQVIAVPARTLRTKIEAAFFSPCETLVVHSSLLENAQEDLRALRTLWPGAHLEIHGVNSLDDCIAAPGIVQIQQRNPYDRASHFIKQHFTILILTGIFLLLGITGHFWWKAQYGYPDLEFRKNKHIGQNALVYNPRRSSHWQFRDFDEVREAMLNFGDLEIGADNTRNIWIWNMTPSTLQVKLDIEGEQRDQWYISWNDGVQSITATDSLRVMIKYTPTREAAANHALFTVRDPDNGELLTSLLLHGQAGPPLPGGYALQFDGKDDLLHFGEDAIAFARDEGTLEFWFRLHATEGCLFSNNRNIPYGPAQHNMILYISDSEISYSIGNHSGNVSTGSRHLSATGIWHHFAVAFSRTKGRIRILLDGKVLRDIKEEFLIEAVSHPFVTFGAFYNGEEISNAFKGDLDEIRIWDTALPPDTIRHIMYRKLSALTPGLIGYWDFDAQSEVTAFNANERTQDGILLHRPAYIRSGVPLRSDYMDNLKLTNGPDNDYALQLAPLQWLQCGSDPVGSSEERSYAIRYFHQPGQNTVIFTVMNQDAYCSIQSASARIVGTAQCELNFVEGWNTVVMTIDDAGHCTIYINAQSECSLSSSELARGPLYRYEGLQIGIFNDKYNSFGPKYYDFARPQLLRTLAIRDFTVWKKQLTDTEIHSYHNGTLSRELLAAHWPLNSLPDSNGNFRDTQQGHLMHLWKYPVWQ